MAKKLIERKDIFDNLVNVVLPEYFPEETLTHSRTSIMGYVTEALAASIEDTVILEQRRADSYCVELSPSEVHVRQTAKIRGVDTSYAIPGKAFAILGILKDDILTKGVHTSSNVIEFKIDRRSTIIHNNVPFSLEDDIIIRAVFRNGKYIYAASYSGEHSSYESYIQMFEQENDIGQEMITMICQIYQYRYNIVEKTVTDLIQFEYDGIEFDYENKLAGFDVYYRNASSDVYKHTDKTHYLSLETTNNIYYNDDNNNIIFIRRNPKLAMGINTIIRCEIKETLGTDGLVTIGNGDTTFSMYRDGAYNYSGVNVTISMLSDTSGATDGDTIADIKKRLIDAKVRRDNITTEHDIISYINDIDANVQIIKKRNDIEDRRYYLYTLLRYNKELIPATTKRLYLKGIQSVEDYGDFDHWDQTVDRKVLWAYNKFKLAIPLDDTVNPDGTPIKHITVNNDTERFKLKKANVNNNDTVYVTSTKKNFLVVDNNKLNSEAGYSDDVEPYAYKVRRDAPETDGFYYTCPFMILLNKYNIASYYFTSVNEDIILNGKSVNSLFPYQMISKSVSIYRDSHDPDNFNRYTLTIKGTMNTSNDSEIVDEEGQIIDMEKVVCYVVFRSDNSPNAYLPLQLTNYDPNTREFTFKGEMVTNDYITESDLLEITGGLYKNGTDTVYGSVIDFKDGLFDIYYMYKTDAWEMYDRSDIIFQYLPASRANGYALMCAYYNTPSNHYDLILEFNKISSSGVKCIPKTETTYDFMVGEVPFIKFSWIDKIIELYSTFENMADVYGSLLKLTTDFDISLKFISTYGKSDYITITGGRDKDGKEIIANLNNLNPTFYFKIYGNNVDVDEIRNYIYEYLRETYITESTIFMSNICTLIEQNFTKVKSIKYMGVDKFDASYQQFTYTVPEFINLDVITRFVPEQLNVTDIRIELIED